jgi:hypothetical protein
MMKNISRLGRACLGVALASATLLSACGDDGGPSIVDQVVGLRFATQPSNGTAGTGFGVVVELLGDDGNVVTSANNPVTLSVGGGATLSGTTTQAATAGRATFSGLTVTQAGTGYVLTATSGPLTSPSTAFVIAPAAASAAQSSVTLTPSTITANTPSSAVFTFKDTYGNPIASLPVTLSTNLAGATFTPASGTTNASGSFTSSFVATAAGSANVTATVGGVQITIPTALTIGPALTYSITTTSNPANGGTVTGAGTVTANAAVSLVATANGGFQFTNWTESGTPVSTSATYAFTATGNRALVANFQVVADPCTPVLLGFPGSVTNTTSGSSCVTFGGPSLVYRFATTGGGHIFQASSTAFTDPWLSVMENPPGTASIAFTNSPTIAFEWLLPAGTYQVRTGSNSSIPGPITLTGTATTGTTGCFSRGFVVGGTFTGQSLVPGDCVFNGTSILRDTYYIRSLKPCVITVTPVGFDARLDIRTDENFGVSDQNAFGVGIPESAALASCSGAGRTLVMHVRAGTDGGVGGNYTITIAIEGGGSLHADQILESPTSAPVSVSRMADVFLQSAVRSQ